MGVKKPSHRDGTLAVHAGEEPDPTTGALDTPIVQSTTFAFADAEDARAQFARERDGHIYTRWRNPTVEAFEDKLAALEGAPAAVALASGMGAVFGALLAHLRAGDHVVAPTGLYAETAKLLRGPLARMGVSATFADMREASNVAAALTPRTRVVWVETPANPTLAIYDIQALAALAHDEGALVFVDNTFATPYHQRPLDLGADLVVHSATKAIGGHGDAVGGVVVGAEERVAAVREAAVRTTGNVMAPMTAWLLARGARTLPLRAARSAATAAALAERLEQDPRVEGVYYPGLSSHEGHALAKRQMRRGFGALLAFEVAGGVEVGRRAYDAVELITRAVSLGDVRTLLTHPAATTHASMSAEQLAAAGISEGLLRLSVGIEDEADLWEDLDRALSGP